MGSRRWQMIGICCIERERKYNLSKMAAKLKDERTYIITVRDEFLSFATFPTPLRSHYLLSLKVGKRETIILSSWNLRKLVIRYHILEQGAYIQKTSSYMQHEMPWSKMKIKIFYRYQNDANV